MSSGGGQGPWWAALILWGVVNGVNLLQAAGFLSRVLTHDRAINHLLGYGIMVLAVPAVGALVGLVREGAAWNAWVGAVVFLVFVLVMLAADYVWPVEFRSPPRYSILVPYLVLFFGSILLMGLPMFRLHRGLWLVTVATSALLLASMLVAMRRGVG